MKKTILFMFTLLIVFSAFAVDRDPLTLSYHGPSPAYFVSSPDQNNITNSGVMYTAPADCTLESWDVLFYTVIGAPPSIVVHVYDEVAGLPGTELGSVTVPAANIVDYTTGFLNVDLTSLTLSFLAGESFFITYTVSLGSYQVAEVQWLSDDGTFAPTPRTYCNYGGNWYQRAALFGSTIEMMAEANIETIGAAAPIFDINFPSLDFGRTAIGGGKYETMVVSNIGGGNIVVQSLALTGDADISLFDPNVGTYPITLASAETMTFYIEYYPSAVGAVTGNVAITIDDREIQNVPVAGVGYVHDSWADAGAIFDQAPAGNQGDNAWSMSTSDLAPGYLHAENFYSLTEDIGSIDFWGINWYHDGAGWVPVDTEDPMTFEIIFYDNDINSKPGTVIETHTPTITRTTVTDSLFSGEPVYKYHFELPAGLALTDGWVSIEGTSVGMPEDAWFMWSTSPMGDVFNAQYNATNVAWDWDDGDLAFALYPVIAVDPPMNVSVAMNGDYPELSWTDVPGLVNNIYRSDTPGGVYNVVGTVTDGAGTYLDVSATDGHYFYHITAASGVSLRQVITNSQGVIRKVPIKKFTNDSMMK